jgi:hypothetical protein
MMMSPGELPHEIGDRRGADGFGTRQFLDRLRGTVEDDAAMAAGDQAMSHVGAHAAESDHSNLHDCLLSATGDKSKGDAIRPVSARLGHGR